MGQDDCAGTGSRSSESVGRERRALAVFEELCDLGPEAAQRRLAELPASEAALAGRVRELLNARARAGSDFLSSRPQPAETWTAWWSRVALHASQIVFALTLLVATVVTILGASRRWTAYSAVDLSALESAGVQGEVLPLYRIGLDLALFVVFASCALWLVVRKRREPFVLLTGIAFTSYGAAATHLVGAASPGVNDALQALGVATLPVVFFLLPDGRFVPSWTRAYSMIWLSLVAVWSLVPSFPLNLLHAPTLWRVPLLGGLWAAACFSAPAVAQLLRYRGSQDLVERLQTRLLVSVLPVSVLGAALFKLPQQTVPALAFHADRPTVASLVFLMTMGPLALVAHVMVPISIVMAVLRYRLLDIDAVLRRPRLLRWALSATLLVLALGIVVAVELAAQSAGLELGAFGLALAALVSAAVLLRLQRWVERSFDRWLLPTAVEGRFAMLGSAGLIGSRIDRYEIVRPAGDGGMSQVFVAEDSRLGRRVALKMPIGHAKRPGTRRRFEREARSMARLRHPHIIEIYDYGYSEGLPFIVMEWIDGPDLARYVREQGPLDCDRTRDLIGALAGAVDHAHDNGIVHRDIKPSNVLLDPREGDLRYVLGDFGAAKLFGTRSELTGRNVFGTVDFMAPEQIRDPDTVGPATDVYALGAVAYFALTGEPLFPRADPAATLYAHVHDPPPDPRELAPDTPEPVARAVRRALAKQRESRFPRAGELAAALVVG